MSADEKRTPHSHPAVFPPFGAESRARVLCWGCSLPTPPSATAAVSTPSAAAASLKSKPSKSAGSASATGQILVPVPKTIVIASPAADLKSSPSAALH